ncbi:MAG: tRNA uridine-5-carboxymethylaminomethyl(34) synthesis enzyme MnmG [Bacilli bacterium]|nr:tRNA uridine-5-carboxymethylaminomethyl(34) synthesis enzyme MnmG [Bacilli bacterium]
MDYEIIVVGGGHAGCEAALASARKNHKTLLITSNIKNIATMPCNPSIGGPAKGIVVREIDALGGEMGKVADKATIQMRMLNSAKGPAVRALRCQTDKIIYPKEMLKVLKAQNNLNIIEGMVEDLIIEEGTIKGVILEDNTKLKAKIVILTTGTYMSADILIGDTKTRMGPDEQKPSLRLSNNLKELGFEILRLKTGTPPRIQKDSIDFSKTKIERGDNEVRTFSFDNKSYYRIEDQEPCYLIYTTPETHKIIKENLQLSSMYGGLVEGIGPRYCPSIEDKVVRFIDKERHQLFLEPESKYYDDIYLQGLSTSMPKFIQERLVKSLPGLENAIIKKYAYAIEYDAINPTQLYQSLETKIINNLFTAGQINGTSGYEEAAAQGLVAGVNASLKLEGKEPLILKRSEAYIGVLIDDLVTKGIMEPYRLLTSRAEFRLLLRHDNADLRLRGYGYQVGLIDEKKYKEVLHKKEAIEKLIKELKVKKIKPSLKINTYLEKLNSAPLKSGISLYALLKRPEIKLKDLQDIIDIDEEAVVEQVEINIKYEGYINKSLRETARLLKYENMKIGIDIDYDKIHNLASEAREKLKKIKPTSLGQAMRISGVNPADISILMIYLKKESNEYGNR